MTLTEFRDKHRCGPAFIIYYLDRDGNRGDMNLKTRTMMLSEGNIRHNQDIIRHISEDQNFERFCGDTATDILLINGVMDNPVQLPIGVRLKPVFPSIAVLSNEYDDKNIEWV
jgi:hypothetical protein